MLDPIHYVTFPYLKCVIICKSLDLQQGGGHIWISHQNKHINSRQSSKPLKFLFTVLARLKLKECTVAAC